MSPRAVIFDFSDTLFSAGTTLEWLTRRGELLPEGADLVTVATRLEAAWRHPEVEPLQDQRDVSADGHEHAVLTWLRAVPETAPRAEELYASLLAPDAWLPYDDTAPALTALHEHGIRVGVVSDIAWDISRHFRAAGIEHLVDAFTLSFHHGVQKPDPRLFAASARELGVPLRDCLMVGDSAPRDGGAVDSGMPAYLLPRVPSVWRPHSDDPTVARPRVRGLDAVVRLAVPRAA